MSRILPAMQIRAMLKHSHPDAPDPPALANAAKAQLDAVLNPQALEDLNDGQYAALIHKVIDVGIDAYAVSNLSRLVNGGNFTLAVYQFKTFGNWGADEVNAWLLGNAT